MTIPDEITEAEAYQQSLLAALGGDDPAEAQATTPAAIRALIADAGPDLRTRPEPGEWAVLGCIEHIVDAELVMAARYRWVLAHDEPEIVGYDQAIWVDRLEHNADDPETSSRRSPHCVPRTSTSGRGVPWRTGRGSAATTSAARRAMR